MKENDWLLQVIKIKVYNLENMVNHYRPQFIVIEIDDSRNVKELW